MLGGIEAGGTKFVCAVGSGPGDLRAEVRFETTGPQETINRAIEFFKEQARGTTLDAVGIAAFGPLDPDPRSETFGFITSTPKQGWQNTDFAGVVQNALRVPVGFDTDVNGAALGEWRWGAAQGLENFIYLTIGTGIGGGGLINGELMHGLVHPEMGHIRIPHDREADPYAGLCPYHGDCLEGMASGPAIAGRWQEAAENLEPDHPAWQLQAHYLALALMNMTLTLSPQRIVLGGGVMRQRQLFPLIRKRMLELLNGYVQAPALLDNVDRFIVPPALGDQAGVLGALALAERALHAK